MSSRISLRSNPDDDEREEMITHHSIKTRSISSYYLISQLFNCVYTSVELNESASSAHEREREREKQRGREKEKNLFDFIGDRAKYTLWNCFIWCLFSDCTSRRVRERERQKKKFSWVRNDLVKKRIAVDSHCSCTYEVFFPSKFIWFSRRKASLTSGQKIWTIEPFFLLLFFFFVFKMEKKDRCWNGKRKVICSSTSACSVFVSFLLPIFIR